MIRTLMHMCIIIAVKIDIFICTCRSMKIAPGLKMSCTTQLHWHGKMWHSQPDWTAASVMPFAQSPST